MKKTNLLLVSFLVMSLSFADNDFIGFCLLVPKHIDIPLYGSADCAEVNDYVINDTINEDYPLIAIKTIANGLAEVYVTYPMKTRKDIGGWLDIKNLGIYLIPSSDSVNLYELPDYKSQISYCIINPVWGEPFSITDAFDGWLKITRHGAPEISGWLPPENQANNPYTPPC